VLWHHAGGAIQCVAFLWNTGPLGNGIAIWLGIEPADLFLYIFLPPMLVDSAVRIDFYIFRKVSSTSCPDSCIPVHATLIDFESSRPKQTSNTSQCRIGSEHQGVIAHSIVDHLGLPHALDGSLVGV